MTGFGEYSAVNALGLLMQLKNNLLCWNCIISVFYNDNEIHSSNQK